MHKNFHIEEGTKVSASTSFPGSVSKVSGILFPVARRKLSRSIDCGFFGSLQILRATVSSQGMRFLWKYQLQECLSLGRVVTQIPKGLVILDQQEWYFLH